MHRHCKQCYNTEGIHTILDMAIYTPAGIGILHVYTYTQCQCVGELRWESIKYYSLVNLTITPRSQAPSAQLLQFVTFDSTYRKEEGEPGPFWHKSNIRVDTILC